MVIASLYPFTKAQDELTPIFDWVFIESLQAHFDTTPEYYVFLPYGCQPPDSIIGTNLHIRSTLELRDFFQESQVDVWHDFGYTPASSLALLRRLSGQNFPITMRVTPSFWVNSHPSAYGALSDNDALICSRGSIHRIIEVAQNQAEDAAALECKGPQIHTIPLGVDPKQVDSHKRRDARHLLRLPEKMTIVLCLADFSPSNSMDLFPLIRAFQTVLDDYKDIILIVSGSDETGYGDRLREYLNHFPLGRQIVLWPNVGESATSLLLAAADIFISPSDTFYNDNQRQVLRAMANGLAVIATDDYKHGYIEQGKTGLKLNMSAFPSSYKALSNYFPFISGDDRSLIISQGIAVDIRQTVAYLDLLIRDLSFRQTLGKSASEYVSKYHDMALIMGKYENLWCNLREKMSAIPPQTTVTGHELKDDWFPLILSSIPQTVEENMPLQITSYGKALLEKQDPIIYEQMSEVLFPPVILEILSLSENTTCISEITRSLLEVSAEEDVTDLAPNIAYHTMWCIKQGLVALKDPDSKNVSTRNVGGRT